MKKIAVFASGFGSNFQAIQEAIDNKKLNAKIELLVSDKPESYAVKRANKLHINVFVFKPKQYKDKASYETEILHKLSTYNIDLVVLAGYMRIIGPTLIHGYKGKIINIHPSLLPAFKGKDAIGQAIEAKVKVTGVTVHLVNEELDSGEIIGQETLDISNLDSRQEIEESIHSIEHKLYPNVIQNILEDIHEKSTY
jgi:phosphoribosylglycinamide formyltransferase-1